MYRPDFLYGARMFQAHAATHRVLPDQPTQKHNIFSIIKNYLKSIADKHIRLSLVRLCCPQHTSRQPIPPEKTSMAKHKCGPKMKTKNVSKNFGREKHMFSTKIFEIAYVRFEFMFINSFLSLHLFFPLDSEHAYARINALSGKRAWPATITTRINSC